MLFKFLIDQILPKNSQLAIQNLFIFLSNNIRNIIKVILLITILALTKQSGTNINEEGINLDQVEIISVSTRIDIANYKPEGSIEGGTWLYIKARGLDQTASNNRVMIGPYPCNIPEKGVNELGLTCETTRAYDPLQRSMQPVELFVDRKQQSKCKIGANCNFWYHDFLAPHLRSIWPASALPHSVVNLYGYFISESTSEFKNIKLDGYLCDRYSIIEGINNLNDDEELNKNVYQSVNCTLAQDIPAGLHNFDIRLVKGYPIHQFSSYQYLPAGDKYQVMIFPEVKQVSQHLAGNQGTKLTIKGAGFGTDRNQVSISAGGLQCDIKELQNTQIRCEVAPGPTTTVDPSLAQQFVSGSGVTLDFYDTSLNKAGQRDFVDTLLSDKDALKNHADVKLVFSQTIHSLEYNFDADLTQLNKGVHVYGYFKAPVTGTYRFRQGADDRQEFYMMREDTVDGSGESVLGQPIANTIDRSKLKLEMATCYYKLFPRNYWANVQTCDKLITRDLELQKDGLYYFELFMVDWGYVAFFSLSVEINSANWDTPNRYFDNYVPEVQKIKIKREHRPQQWRVKLWGINDPFKVKFSYINPANNKVDYSRDTSDKLSWSDWTGSKFRSQVDRASNYFGLEITRHDTDDQGNVLPNTDEEGYDPAQVAAGAEWILSFTLFRITPAWDLKPQLIFDNFQGSWSSRIVIEKIQEQSDQVAGNFKLSFAGIPITEDGYQGTTDLINFSRDSWSLQWYFRRSFQEWSIESFHNNRDVDGREWYIIFYGMPNNGQYTQQDGNLLPLFTFDDSLLTGGIEGTKPYITVERVQAMQNIPLFDTIQGDMLYTPANNPQILVKVTDQLLTSACTAPSGCEFVTDSALNIVLESFTHTDGLLTLIFATGTDFTTNNIQFIRFGGSECTNINAANPNSVTCDLPTNPDASSVLEGGQHKPIIYANNIGYVDTTAVSVTSQTITPTVTTITPSSGNIRGNQEIIIQGTGFPITDITSITVTFGSVQAQVLSTSNQQLVVLSTANNEGVEKIQVTVGQQQSDTTTSTSDFTYNTVGVPTITSVSLTSASPVVKQPWVVTGTNFGTDHSQLKLYLYHSSNDTVAYELYILSTTETEIQSTLSGGVSGSFKVVVWKKNLGNSIGNIDFTYEIKVTSFEPNSGSDNGGTILKIRGTNFCADPIDNAVFFSHDDSDTHVRCIVTESNKEVEVGVDEIKCITPPLPVTADQIRTYVIWVQGKILVEAECALTNSGVCEYTYESAKTPTITIAQNPLQLTIGTEVTLIGTGFDQGAATDQIFIRYLGTTQIPVTFIDATSVRFTVPETVVAGSYPYVSLFVGNLGETTPFAANVAQTCTGLSQQGTSITTASRAGIDITIEGTGFLAGSMTVEMNSIQGKIRSTTTTQILTRLPLQSNDQVYTITVFRQDDVNIFCTIDIQYVTPLTIVSYTPTTTQSSDSFTIDFVSTDDLSGIIPYLEQVGSLIQFTGTLSGSQLIFTDVPAGQYQLFASKQGNGQGYVFLQQTGLFTVELTQIGAAPVSTSFGGGQPLVITGKGFDLINNNIKVCGFSCNILTANNTQLECQLPQVNTAFINNQYGTNTKPNLITSDYVLFGNNVATFANINDNKLSTHYQSSGLECYAGYDFGQDIRLKLTSMVVYPNSDSTFNAQDYQNIVFQGSNDNINWIELFKAGSSMNAGRNTFPPGYAKGNGQLLISDTIEVQTLFDLEPYRYIRFYNTVTSGNALCSIAEMTLYGYKYYKVDSTNSIQCDVRLNVNGQTSELLGKVTYDIAITPKVTDISPMYGWQLGGDSVTVTGQGFGSEIAQVQVLLDNILCGITQITDNEIVCTTGNKGANNYALPSIKVIVGGNAALIHDNVQFYYGLLWSREESWGGESKPRAGDTVFVPKGSALIVDESSPIYLQSIIVEGSIIFADNGPLTLDTEILIVRMGKFIAGTEQRAYQNQLIITLYGSLQGIQLPEYGNKGIACHKCQLDIHGTPKTPTWTMITTTVEIGANSLVTMDTTNWVAGDQLVIASTDFDHHNAEVLTITSITGQTINFTPELAYRHFSDEEIHGGAAFTMRAEVGCLTRNIVIQGNPADSLADQYGGHLMLHGKAAEGLLGRIEQAEFRFVGQPKILGRYPIHFHMNGDVSSSYVRGNAIHDSNARCVTIHAVFGLRVQENVCYKAHGHNIFLEDGIEEGNLIEYNLVVSSRFASNMLQTDTSVASIWITNPNNIVRYNHVAGSDFYGFWYEIKEHPDGPSGGLDDVCPQGNRLGQFHGNVAHSNARFGLRFFVLSARANPCEPFRDDSLPDPWASNPSILQEYTNFTTYKNGECGVLAEDMGYTHFINFKIADSHRSGLQLHVTNLTKEEVVLKDSFILGRSNGNAEPLAYHAEQQSSAIIAPRTDGFRSLNNHFINFGAGMVFVESVSENQQILLRVQGGYQINLESTTLINCDDANIVRWRGIRSNILFDVDGTLTNPNGVDKKPTYVTPYYKHFDQAISDGKCQHKINNYDDSAVCDGVSVRKVMFRNFEKFDDFVAIDIRLHSVGPNTVWSNNMTQDTFGVMSQFLIKVKPTKDGKDAYVVMFPTGYMYNVHWLDGVDWSHMMLVPSIHTEEADENIILRFNHTKTRELFESRQMIAKQMSREFSQLADKSVIINDEFEGAINKSPNVCNNGDFAVDSDNKFFYVCLNGKENGVARTNQLDSIVLDGIFCKNTCPEPGLQCTRTAQRLFTTTAQWLASPQGTDIQKQNFPLRKRPNEQEYTFGYPQIGDDVLIPCEWVVKFNLEEFEFGTLIIDGILTIDTSKANVLIKAKNIWIRGGELQVLGENDGIYNNNFELRLIGDRDNQGYTFINNDAGARTKAITLTGKLIMKGRVPGTARTRLTANAAVGATTLQVAEAKDWQIGDQLALGPSGFDSIGDEKVTISDISGTTITISQPLQFFHYGNAQKTVSADNSGLNSIGADYGGDLDMRCAVGHLTRNIKITGSNEGSLGGTLFVYRWMETDSEIPENSIDKRGFFDLTGVEFSNMGQKNGQDGAIYVYKTHATLADNIDDIDRSVLSGVAIHDCDGICFNANFGWFFNMTNNVIYSGEKFLIQNLDFNHQKIVNNLLIGAKKRDSPALADTSLWDPVGAFYMWKVGSWTGKVLEITDNVAQGSDGIGFSFPGIPCDLKDQYPFKRNTAGNSQYVGVVFHNPNDVCYYMGEIGAYGAIKGVIVTVSKSSFGVEFDKFRVAECKTNLVLRWGTKKQRINPGIITNSWFSGLARIGCTDCYSNDDRSCKNNFGLQLAVSNENGETMPWFKNPLVYDVLCVATTVFQTMTMRNIKFHNYKLSYTDLPMCFNNFAMHTNPSSSDATAGHYMTQVTCDQCDVKSYFRLEEPQVKWRGWFGGCGTLDCTGPENVLIQDLDGSLFGTPKSIISKNEQIGEILDSCIVNVEGNNYVCDDMDFGILEFQGLGEDLQKLIPVPIVISNNQFQNTLNIWREWYNLKNF